nr:tRNA 5-methoxyuridine(34)/uridine 5-oxyacetic acid(34) synthase CmoB [Helicobacter cholecystus]
MMIDSLRQEAQKKLLAKNIVPLIEKISALPSLQASLELNESIKINFTSLNQKEKKQILECALALKPWRKGPFELGDLRIESEWNSSIKWNLLTPYLNLRDKDIADIGCNNGYYMFQMLSHSPKSITGFDPYALFKCQFDFINHFIKTSIVYEMLGIEHLEKYGKKFDMIFCMGVLYHRTDPITTLKTLAKSLKNGGEVILDTLILQTQEDLALCPRASYAKMSNAYFIPSPSALQGWCERAGFESVELLEIKQTQNNEQRKTPWIDTMSLEDFLSPYDLNLTIEGYQAPIRGYFKLKRK